METDILLTLICRQLFNLRDTIRKDARTNDDSGRARPFHSTLFCLDSTTRLAQPRFCWTRLTNSRNGRKWMDFSLTPQSHVTPQHAGVRGEVEEREVGSQGSLYDWTSPTPSTTSTTSTNSQTHERLACKGRAECRLTSFFFKEKWSQKFTKKKKKKKINKLIWMHEMEA